MLKFSFISLRTKLIVAFIVFVIVPIFATSIYAYQEFEDILRRQIETAASDRLHQVNLNIERKLKSMMDATNSIVLDENAKQVLVNPPSTPREMLDATHVMDKKFLEISTAIVINPLHFTVIDNSRNMYTSWGRNESAYDLIVNSDWYEQTIKENGYMLWTLNHDNYVNRNRSNLITVSMVIKDSSFSDKIGTLIISESVDHYLEILRNREGSDIQGYGFLLGADGTILAEDEELVRELYTKIEPRMNKTSNFTGSMTVDNEQYVVSSFPIALTGWKVVQIVPHKEIFKQVDTIRFIVSTTLLLSLTLFIVVIVVLSFMFTQPLRKLRTIMKSVEIGNLDVQSDIRTHDEVGMLGRSFNKMVIRLRQHIRNEIVLERRKEQARLEALQAQINPHFLHNTLNTIRWMSIMAGTKPITEMLTSLGHLLDMSIHRGQEEIRLQEELENVRYFLTIQKYRFGDNIEIIEQIDANTTDCLVPKLSLQPLVENVYRHASFDKHGGRMIIRAFVTGTDLTLQVIDNGLSVNKEQMDNILSRIHKEDRDQFSGIGLRNVHKRLKMMYGDKYGLHIDRDEQEGNTYVTITLPYREGETCHETGSH